MGSTPDVSIILPALSVNNDYLRCLCSIRAALSDRITYEVISVVPDVSAFSELTGEDIRIISEDGPGIYAAMNTGVGNASGKYIYFIGQDDILLPDAARALLQGEIEEADVILANVFWGGGRIHKNYTLRRSLVWTNWCHQGVFYKRSVFLRVIKAFRLEYKAQADHYSNILLSTDKTVKITKYTGCIAWYSATGFSTQWPDLVFREAFPSIVRKHFGLVSYSAVRLKRSLLRCIRLVWKVK